MFISVYKDTHDGDLHPPHPGEILREDILPLLSLTRRQFARHLGVSVRVLSELLSERRSVTLDIAQRLGVALGQGARYWLGLQMQHDVWLTTQAQTIAVTPLSWGKRPPRGPHQAFA
jgi:addiction module HigA family antidote